MKNSMIYMAMAAVALASCSKNEISETNLGPAIEFRAAMGTRAETTLDNLGGCKLTAIDSKGAQLFADQYVLEGNTLVHYNGNVYYWPVDGSDVAFYAIGPYSDGLSGMTNSLLEYRPEAEGVDLNDIVTATATANKSTGASGVALTFQHPLSQIVIQAKTDNAVYNLEVIGWRLANIGTNATYDLTAETPAWTDCLAMYTYEGAIEAKTLDGTYREILESACLIPQQLTAWNVTDEPTNASLGAYLALKVRITTKAGGVIFPKSSNVELTHDWVAIPIDTNWEPGVKYTYKLDFTNGAGNVDPTTPTPDPDTDPDNPFNPGDEVLGGVKIQFSQVSVNGWSDGTITNGGEITM